MESVKQYKVNVPDELSKVMVIKERIFEFGERLGQTIIFVRTRNSASMLHKSLVDLGYDVTTIQGALKQDDRDRIVKEFKDGLTQVLISTDLLARGFDQQQVYLPLISLSCLAVYKVCHPDIVSFCRLIWSSIMIFLLNMTIVRSLIVRFTYIELAEQGVLAARVGF